MNQMPSPRLEECRRNVFRFALRKFEMRRRDVHEAIFQGQERE